MFLISPPQHLSGGFSDGYLGNTFKKYNKQMKSWNEYDHELYNKTPLAAQRFMIDIADNFKFIATSITSPKVKKIIEQNKDQFIFDEIDKAISFLQTLNNKTKTRIKIIK